MDGEAVREIAQLSNGQVQIERDGKVFSPLGMKPVFHDPRPSALQLHTLDGLIAYVAANPDKLDFGRTFVVVDSPESVSLVTDVHGEANERHTVVHVSWNEIEPFQFGRFIESEDFNIGLRAKFFPGPDLDKLISYVARIDIQNNAEITDDGITQSANVRRGVSGHVTESQPAPSMPILQPFRTFGEVAQPESLFSFRMRSGNGISCALFEADGGRWRQEASKSIQAYLQDHLPSELMVIG